MFLFKVLKFRESFLPASQSFSHHHHLPVQSSPLQLTVKDDAGLSKSSHQNQRILQDFKAGLEHVAEKGMTDGVNDHSPTEREEAMNRKQEEAASKLKHNFLEVHEKAEKAIHKIKSRQSEVKDKEDYLKKLTQAKQDAVSKAKYEIKLPHLDIRLAAIIKKHRTVNGVVSALQESLRHFEEKQNILENSYQKLLNAYQRIPPLKKFYDHQWAFYAIITLLSCLEIGVNLNAFQSVGLGENNFIATGLAIFFVVIQAGCAESLGFAWRKGLKKRKKLFLQATIFICVVISGFRISMDVDIMSKVTYLLINFIIAGSTTILAFFCARHYDFFLAQKERYQLADKIDQTHYAIKDIKEDYQNKCVAIEGKMEEKAEKMMEADSQNLAHEIQHYEDVLLSLAAHERKVLQQLEVTKQNALQRYHQLYQNAKNDSEHLHATKRHKEFLNEKLNGKQNVIMVVLVALIGLTSCSSEPALTSHHLEVMYDQTDTTHQQDIDHMVTFILEHIPIDTIAGEWAEATITLSQIGHTSTQMIESVTLPASQPWWWRNELKHRHIPAQFKAALKQALVKITLPGTGQDKSSIHRNFYYRLHELIKHKGDLQLLSWSDLILNDPHINFYHYKKHPQQITQHQDSLIQFMTKAYPLPDLTGVSIINIYQPPPWKDELHEVSKNYFHHCWSQHGAKVEFKTNIPLHHDHQSITQHH